jgi:cytochrome P450
LLVLSQLPELRRELHDLAGNSTSGPSLLDCVISESLRLLTPNAMMTRVTSRVGVLNGQQLPERCELLLCPFLAHREAKTFPRPSAFLPQRWQKIRPSQFEYFPFGAGGHACVGKSLGLHVIKAALVQLLPEFDLVLAGDQDIDWQVHIIFMPRSDPQMTVQRPATPAIGGKLSGPVRELIEL